MKFKLTLEFPSTAPVEATKTFNTKHKGRGWALARRWENHCLTICGKNHKGEEFVVNTLEILDN